MIELDNLLVSSLRFQRWVLITRQGQVKVLMISKQEDKGGGRLICAPCIQLFKHLIMEIIAFH
jgi:hypothetical protein